MPVSSTSFFSRPSLLLALAPLLASACDSAADTSNTGGGGSGGGGAGTSTGAGGSGAATTGGSGGGTTDCPQVASMLDLSNAIGAGEGYEKPTLTSKCTEDTFVVDGNGIPHYAFVQTTPNALVAQAEHYEITRNPQVAAQTTAIPLLGTIGFAVNGQPLFGPNEAAQPADEAYGDPIYNGLMDPCLGHTAFQYHYHALAVKCLNAASLVEKPWMNDDPPANEPSPIIAWALDGFPVLGPQECTDASCATVVEMKSGFVQTGDPKMNAWDAYTWEPHDDATYLDECNGHVGPAGDYHYHATAGFPYILGCYRGTTGTTGAGGGGGAGAGGMGAGGGMMGPQSCDTDADCGGACPPGSLGCVCQASPMGDICVPTCQSAADCPDLPGMTFNCNNGVCVP